MKHAETYQLRLNGIYGETVCTLALSASLEEAVAAAERIAIVLGQPGYYEKARSIHVVEVKERIVHSSGPTH